jgi:LmbE family N-acetylglucosaminyl deacetylase
MRKREELRAASIASYRPTFWNFPEYILRHRRTSNEYHQDSPGLRNDPAWSSVVTRLRSELSSVDVDVLLAPLAPGGHRDHDLVHEAAVDHLRSTASIDKFALYEDLPYCARVSAERITKRINDAPVALRPVVIGLDFLSLKLSLLRCYQSQLDDADLNTIAGYALDMGGERIWFGS